MVGEVVDAAVELMVTDEDFSAMADMAEKYQRLVWLERHYRRKSDPGKWEEIDEVTQRRATKRASVIERRFPDDAAAVFSGDANAHVLGFNLGMLAGMRFALTCISRVQIPPNELTEVGVLPNTFGGHLDAIEDFPDLDT